MCENCLDIILRDSFYLPQDYLNCLDYIKSLVAGGKYKMVKQTCDLDNIKNEKGCWVDDIISHEISVHSYNSRIVGYGWLWRFD